MCDSTTPWGELLLGNREESYRGTARGFAPSAAVHAQWRRARRLSLKEVLAEADAGAEFAWRHALEGRIAARLREAR